MPKKLTLEVFVNKAKRLYGDKYDYSKVIYVNTETKVCITCPEHGDFWITPHNFLNNHSCPECSGHQRITKEIFIERSTRKHKGRYDYSKVVYQRLDIPVTIICPVHGEFQQLPSGHMYGNGCPICFGSPKSTTEEFIRKAKEIYGDQYDYSKVDYTGNKEKVCIICPEHGEFWMTPNNHLRGHHCPECYGTPKLTTEQFIARAKRVHGDRYNYSKIDYQGLSKKVCVICRNHGEYWVYPQTHLKGGNCPTCNGILPTDLSAQITRIHRITLPIFIEKCTQKHNGKYDYSGVNFVHLDDFVKIICPYHGEFWQRAKVHYRGYGCPVCGGSKRLTNEEFIEKAKLVHEDKYDYSKVQYVNTATKVCIICPEHGDFWQTPNNHLFGAGCPTCPESNMEGEIRHLLLANNIAFEQEKGFDWLRYNRSMFLDFFLPEYGVAIECQGRQHFSPSRLFGGEDFFKITIERDAAKKKLCEEHGIQILYYSNAHIKYPYPVFESMRALLKAIKERVLVSDNYMWKQQLTMDFGDK